MPDSHHQLAGDVDSMTLVRLLQTEPSAGAAALYDRYGRIVFSVALRMLGDRAIAEEITQDVFVHCWHHIAQYQTQRGTLLQWLLGITHHRAIDELRSRRHHARLRETPLDDMDLSTAGVPDQVDLQLLQSTVRAALADLPPAQREVIELLYYGGLTRQEAATRLNTPLGTIHTRLRLGFAKLRAALAPVQDDTAGAPQAAAVSEHQRYGRPS